MQKTENKPAPLNFTYIFRFENDSENVFTLQLDKETLEFIEQPADTYPAWAALDNCQCDNCPLTPKTHPFCPAAVHIADLIEFVKNSPSYERVDVEVQTDVRTYLRHTTLQKGVSSLMGLIMATSGCPILGKLKPMARYHLPFCTLTENSYRAITMFLISQYFLYRKGGKPDWELKKLLRIYDEIHTVNRCFWKRLNSLNLSEDAGVNALLILDNLGSHLHYQIDEDHLSEIELLCDKYFS